MSQILFPRINPLKFYPVEQEFSAKENIFPDWQNTLTNEEYLLTSNDVVNFQFSISKSETQNIEFRLYYDCNKIDDVITLDLNNITEIDSNNSTFLLRQVYDDVLNNLLVYSIQLNHDEIKKYVTYDSSSLYFELDFNNLLSNFKYRSEKYIYTDDNKLLENYPDLLKLQFKDFQDRYYKGYKFEGNYITVLCARKILGQTSYDNDDEVSTNLQGEDMILRDNSLQEFNYHINNSPFFILDLFINASGFDDLKINGEKVTKLSIPSVKRQTSVYVDFEIEVKQAEYNNYLDLQIVQPDLPEPDLILYNTDSSLISATGNGVEWVHNPSVSYLYATDGKDKVSSITACNAGVNGLVDLSSNEWLNLAYLCLKNGNNIDLKLGEWINKDNVTIDVENVFYNLDDFDTVLTELETVNDGNEFDGRVFNVGTVLVDLDSRPDIKARIDALELLGWTINIVNYKILSATIGYSNFANFKNRVTSNNGSEIWLLNSIKIIDSTNLNEGDVIELYHSDYTFITEINMNDLGVLYPNLSDIINDHICTLFLKRNPLNEVSINILKSKLDTVNSQITIDINYFNVNEIYSSIEQYYNNIINYTNSNRLISWKTRIKENDDTYSLYTEDIINRTDSTLKEVILVEFKSAVLYNNPLCETAIVFKSEACEFLTFENNGISFLDISNVNFTRTGNTKFRVDGCVNLIGDFEVKGEVNDVNISNTKISTLKINDIEGDLNFRYCNNINSIEIEEGFLNLIQGDFSSIKEIDFKNSILQNCSIDLRSSNIESLKNIKGVIENIFWIHNSSLEIIDFTDVTFLNYVKFQSQGSSNLKEIRNIKGSIENFNCVGAIIEVLEFVNTSFKGSFTIYNGYKSSDFYLTGCIFENGMTLNLTNETLLNVYIDSSQQNNITIIKHQNTNINYV